MLKLIKLDQLQPDMVLAKSVYDENENLVLRSGVKLTGAFIDLLKKSGQTHLYIGNPSIGLDMPEVIPESLRLKAARMIKEIIESIRAGNKDINVKAVERVVDEMIWEVQTRKKIFIGMADPRTVRDYLHRHSVNVCIISLVMAKSLFPSNEKMRELGVGALLHDIGKAMVPKAILEKKGSLSNEEFATVKEHTKFGYSLLTNKKDVSLFTRHVPYQHHERSNGSGYPRGLTGSRIADYAKIVSLVDAFDAMSSDRPHAEGIKTGLAIKKLFKQRKAFDLKIMKVFLRTIAPYPIGEKVKLSNGQSGYVVKIKHREVDRPIVSLYRGGIYHYVDLTINKRLDVELSD